MIAYFLALDHKPPRGSNQLQNSKSQVPTYVPPRPHQQTTKPKPVYYCYWSFVGFPGTKTPFKNSVHVHRMNVQLESAYELDQIRKFGATIRKEMLMNWNAGEII